MSVWKTVYLLFKSDTKDLKKGAKEAEDATKSLDNNLRKTNKDSEELGKNFLNLAHKAAGVFAGIVTVSALINKAGNALSNVADLDSTARSLQVNISALDSWGNAVERAGGSSTEFARSLKSISEHFNTTGNQALRLLPRLADSFAKMGQFRALQYGKILGLDEKTILFLQRGRREVEDLVKRQRELGVVTQQDAEQTRKFKESLHDASVASQSFFRELASPFLPIFTKALDYLVMHKDLVIGAFVGIGAAAAIMFKPFTKANLLLWAIRGTIGLVIALFAILYEDISAYQRGDSSLTGELLEKWPKVAEVIKDSCAIIKDAIESLFHPLQTLQNWFNKIQNNSFLSKTSDAVFGRLRGLIHPGSEDAYQAAASTHLNFRNNILPTSATIAGRTTSRIVNVSGPINISTQATDAQGVAAGIYQGLNEQLAQLTNFVDDGVVA